MDRLTIAISQFPSTADIAANSRWIRRHMRQARARGAAIVQFPEGALSGYAGFHFDSFGGFDWRQLARETRRIRELAAGLKLWTILGTAHPNRRGKPFNSLYLVSDAGRIATRYDKCFCLPGDLKRFRAGRRYVTHTLRGIRFGLLICFDFRFPESYRQYLLRGCKLVFNSFHAAGPTPHLAHKRRIGPAHLMSRAAENFMYVAVSNVAGTHQWWPSCLLGPDGSTVKTLRTGPPGLLVATIDLTKKQNWDTVTAGPFARAAARGRLHTE